MSISVKELQPASSAVGSVATTDGNTGKKLSEKVCYQLHRLSIRSSVPQGMCGPLGLSQWMKEKDNIYMKETIQVSNMI